MSNYDDVTENWRQKFLKEMDQEKIINKFRLCADDNYIYIIYFNHEYRVGRKNGKIQRKEEPDREVGFNTQMVIYNTFYYAVENPCASGELVPFRQVKRVYPFEKAYRETVIQTLQTVFSGHVEELKKAGFQEVHYIGNIEKQDGLVPGYIQTPWMISGAGLIYGIK